MATDTFPSRPDVRTPSRRRSLLSLTLALSALATLSACNADDAKVDAAACDAAVTYGAAFAEAPREPGEIPAYAKERLLPIGDALERHLDGDAEKAAAVLRATFAKVADTGDLGALETPDAAAARSTVGKAIHDGCDVQKVDVRAVEYMYVGAPKTLKPGRVSFAMKNEGVEEHEMVLFKRAADSTVKLDDLLAMPDEEAAGQMIFTGVAFGGPSTTNYVTVDLEAGTYFLVCFLPQGNDGPPHFMDGMKETIVVS